MKNNNTKKHPLITIISLFAIVILAFTGVGCGNQYGDAYKNCPSPNPGLYCNNSRSVKVADGGSLIAFLERQTEGEFIKDTLSVRYRVKNNYTGSKKVAEIKATWRVNAQFRRQTSESFSASIGVGETSVNFSVAGSESVEYQDKSVQKYFTNTNGVKEVYYGPSNYTLYPYKQLNSQSLTNAAYLKLKSHATPFSITASL